jgi:glycopeptide antibiotics resistance protein
MQLDRRERLLNARHYSWLALGFTAFVIYGSLLPFHFAPMPLGDAFGKFWSVVRAPLMIGSRSDFATNVLLFIPLGYLLMGALTVDRPPFGRLATSVLVPFACALFSASIEFTQLYFPPRVTSAGDIVGETLGSVIGTVGWLLVGQGWTIWLRVTFVDMGRQGAVSRLLALYVVFLVFVHVFPLDLTLGPADLWHKYKEGGVLLIPFVSSPLGFWEVFSKVLTNMGYFFPVGFLLGRLVNPFWRRLGSWPSVLAVGVGLAAVIEFMQVFVVSRIADTTDILTGGLAVLTGWGASLWFSASQATRKETWAWRLGLLVWLTILVVINWEPFDFDLSLATATGRLRAMPFVPFADYQAGNYLHSFDEIVQKIALFIPLGMTLSHAWPSPTVAVRRSIISGALVAAMFEAGQLFLPTRYASVTDVCIETLGAVLGVWLARRLRGAE